MPPEWLEDLAPLGTDWRKPFLEGSPYLVAVFKRAYEGIPGRGKNDYVEERVGLARGLLLAAIQNPGLVNLTHTPAR
jgi:iodotyrosine deiodinase